MNRRDFLTACLATVFMSDVAHAQAPQRVFRLGVLGQYGPSQRADVLFATLRELGYVENKNLLVERRYGEGNADRLPALAAQLVAARVDVLVAQGAPAAFAAKEATSVVPIVIAAQTDPVSLGLVASLARPGGNVTGTSLMAADLSAKRLELLRAFSPRISHVAMLWNSSSVGMAVRVKETQWAADRSHVTLRALGPRSVEELERAFADLTRQRPDAVIVTFEPFTLKHQARIIEFCASVRVPCMFEERTFVDAGGLMSYGPDATDIFKRAAVYVDKLFKGAKPGDLPIEQPTKFDLVINAKTARALGLAIPQEILLRADKVIE